MPRLPNPILVATATIAAAQCGALAQAADVAAGVHAGTPAAFHFGQLADDLRTVARMWAGAVVARG